MTMPNILAYDDLGLITAVKMFMVHSYVVGHITLFAELISNVLC
jgi:hypothetical protein